MTVECRNGCESCVPDLVWAENMYTVRVLAGYMRNIAQRTGNNNVATKAYSLINAVEQAESEFRNNYADCLDDLESAVSLQGGGGNDRIGGRDGRILERMLDILLERLGDGQLLDRLIDMLFDRLFGSEQFAQKMQSLNPIFEVPEPAKAARKK